MLRIRRLLALLIDSGPVVVLAGIAAAGSFSHIRHLAEAEGQHGWKAWAVAVCIDLMCVMAARERHRDAVTGRAVRGLVSWPTLVLSGGVVLTLAANLAEAGPGVWGHIVAGTPAAAFLVAVSMLERRAVHHSASTPDPVPVSDTAVEPVSLGERQDSPVPLRPVLSLNGSAPVGQDRPKVGPVDNQDGPEPGTGTVPAIPVPTAHAPNGPSLVSSKVSSSPPAAEGAVPSAALVAFARQIADQHHAAHGKPITRDQLRSRLRVGTDLATVLHRQLRDQPNPA